MSKKTIFYLLWFLLLSLGPITVLRNSSGLTVNFFQRIFGLLAFTLIFIQLILGAFMPKLIEKFGGWIFKFHVTEGIFTYVFVLAHPLLFVFDPLYVFLGFSSQKAELFYSFGRSAFWLITVAVIAALLRTQPWLQNNWRKFHILNYVAFFLIWFHALKVGTDIGMFPFSLLHGPSIVIVSAIVFYKLYAYFKPRFLNNANSADISRGRGR